MSDLILIGLYALAAGAVVGVVGEVALRLLRNRSIILHVCVLLTITVASVVAGVAAVARAMFLSAHDLQVVLITVAASAAVSLGVGATFGRRLATASVWATRSSTWPSAASAPGRRSRRTTAQARRPPAEGWGWPSFEGSSKHAADMWAYAILTTAAGSK